MLDRQPKRVMYPLNGGTPTEADIKNNKEHDPTNIWGERFYYYNCHRDGGDFAWFKDNLGSAAGAPKPEQVTAAWTFDGKWDLENKTGPSISKIEAQGGQIAVTFSENVTVKGHPRLTLRSGGMADYAGCSGPTVLFNAPIAGAAVTSVDLAGGAIMAGGGFGRSAVCQPRAASAGLKPR